MRACEQGCRFAPFLQFLELYLVHSWCSINIPGRKEAAKNVRNGRRERRWDREEGKKKGRKGRKEAGKKGGSFLLKVAKSSILDLLPADTFWSPSPSKTLLAHKFSTAPCHLMEQSPKQGASSGPLLPHLFPYIRLTSSMSPGTLLDLCEATLQSWQSRIWILASPQTGCVTLKWAA